MPIIGNLPVVFCRNVTWLRKRYYLSKRALAALSGLSETTLKYMEDCERPPEIQSVALERLSQIFGISIEKLVHSDAPKNMSF